MMNDDDIFGIVRLHSTFLEGRKKIERMKRFAIMWLGLFLVFASSTNKLSAEKNGMQLRLPIPMTWNVHKLSTLKRNDPEKRSLGLLSDIKDDVWNTVKSPHDWDWAKVAGVVGGGLLLYAADKKITAWIKSQRSKVTCAIAKFAENFGNRNKVILALAAFALYNSLTDRQYAKDTSLLLFRSVLTTQLFIQGIKIAAGRERPYVNGNPRKFHFITLKRKYWSHPSGHSAMAFTLAAVLSARTKEKAWDFLYYGIATLTALSRVHDEKHWTSDVFIGAALGYFISRGVIKRFEEERQKQVKEAFINGPPPAAGFFMQPYSLRGTKPFRFFPIAGVDSFGMSMCFQFN
jgi:membrane-associated phospholipid phosphatase